jgi:hypothetical protein
MKMVAITMQKFVAPSSSSSMTIWVGGTSALAQTYVVEEIILLLQKNKNDDNDARNNNNNNNNNRYFILASPDPPMIMDDTTTRNTTSTISSVSTTKKCFSYQKLDMTKRNSIDAFFDRILMTMARMTNNNKNVKNDYGHDDGTTTTTTTTTTRSTPTTKTKTIIKITIIFGMRASLVTGTQIDHLSLVEHVPYFIEQVKLRFSDSDEKQEVLLTGILHVSSVAVMDHTKCQSMLNEDDSSSSLPDSPSCYSSPYDLMKRQTEDAIASTCKELDLIFVHLRISGIFSNEGKHHYDYQVEEQDDDNKILIIKQQKQFLQVVKVVVVFK